MQHSESTAQRATYYREQAARLRQMAEVEDLLGFRSQLIGLAKQVDQLVEKLETGLGHNCI